MASEILINRLYQMIDEIARLGGEQERTSIVPGILVADASPSDLPTGYIKIVNPRDGTYVPCLTVSGLVVSDNDLVNVLFTKGTEPIALSQSAGSPSSSIKVYQLWESDFGAVAWQTDTDGHLSATGKNLTTTGKAAIGHASIVDDLTIKGQSAASVVQAIYAGDGDGTDFVSFIIYGVGTPGSVANRERLIIQYNTTGPNFRIQSEAQGTGTLREIVIETEGNTNQLVLRTDGEITATENFSADAHGFIVKNTSGATATAGDVGYLDASNEYKTTTTAADEKPHPVIVLIGGANNADIYVSEGPGRGTMNYTGTAPTTGQFVVFSTTAGKVASAGGVMSPAVLGRARANGSGGTVEVELLLRTIPWVAGSANSIYQPNSGLTTTAPSSDWSGTIATLPGGNDLTYNTTGGDEEALAPASASHIGRILLHNTTRGNSALITAVNTGTNTITVDSLPGSWATTDVITIRSQTNTTNLGTAFFIDLQLGSELPDTIRSIDLGMSFNNSAAANLRAGVHPFEANATSKRQLFRNQVINQVTTTGAIRLRVVDKKICMLWQESGAGNDSNYLLELRAYNVAA